MGLSGMELVILDLDGVIYRGSQLLPHAVEAVKRMQDSGRAVYFLTNNSTRTRKSYVERLARLGIATDERHLMTSAYATALYLVEQGWVPARALVVGERGLAEELRAVGVEPVRANQPDGAALVVVGLDRHFNYRKLTLAHRAVLSGARLIATNRDPTYPVEEGVIPGGGCMVAAIETATGQSALLVGKPSTYSLERILAQSGVPADRALMVGDRLDTDVEVGWNAGLRTALVLTGVTTRQQAETAPPHQRPDRIFEHLGELAEDG